STVPPSRFGAVMTYDAADGYLLLFGGASTVSGNSADTWKFKGGAWKQLTPVTSPPGRNDAVMTFDAANGYVLLFGGLGFGGDLGDAWRFRAGHWTHVTPRFPFGSIGSVDGF